MGLTIKKINETLDVVAFEREKFQFREGIRDVRIEDNDGQQTHSFTLL